MTNELSERLIQATRENAKLTVKLQMAGTEIGSLKAELLGLREKLEDAHNEIARMDMLMKHRMKSIQSEDLPNKLNGVLRQLAGHH